MTATTGPRWTVSYRKAGAPHIETLTVEGGSLVTAYKDAVRRLWKRGEPIHITAMVEVTEIDATPYAVDADTLVNFAAPGDGDVA